MSESNVLRLRSGKYATGYPDESALVHEVGHAIQLIGIDQLADKTLQREFDAAYQNAKNRNLWPNTYAISNRMEFFATGTTIWFNVMSESYGGNFDGVRGPVNTREEMLHYYKQTYDFFAKIYPHDAVFPGAWAEPAPNKFGAPGGSVPSPAPTPTPTASPSPQPVDIAVGLAVEPSKIIVELDKAIHQSLNRIVVMVNNSYIGESYNGVSYYGSVSGSNPLISKLIFESKISMKSGDIVNVHLLPGVPGNSLDLNKGRLLASKTYVVPAVDTVSTPSNLRATQATHQVITLSWNTSNVTQGVANYVIFRDGKIIGTTQTNQFSDTTVAPKTIYRYEIQARDTQGKISLKSNILSVASAQARVTDVKQWRAGGHYNAGETVQHQGNTYVVLQSHTNYGDPNWAPDLAASLFRKIK